MGKNKKQKFVDDGRTIANMNVEGMPWYNPATAGNEPESVGNTGANRSQEPTKLTGKETAAMIKGVIAAALLIAVIFIGVFGLFILFCSNIWLK